MSSGRETPTGVMKGAGALSVGQVDSKTIRQLGGGQLYAFLCKAYKKKYKKYMKMRHKRRLNNKGMDRMLILKKI